jgi:hypothetical protein
MAINYSAENEKLSRQYRDAGKEDKFDIKFPEMEYGYGMWTAPLVGSPTNVSLTEGQRARCNSVTSVLRLAYMMSEPNAVIFLNGLQDRLNRTYFYNGTGVDLLLTLGGQRFGVDNSDTYACHPSEFLLLDQQTYAQTGIHLTVTDAADFWTNADTDLLFFYS